MSDGDSGRKFLYDPHIFICTAETGCTASGKCCGASGAAELLGYMKGAAKGKGVTNIRVNRSTCMERCDAGPVMLLYPEGVWYSFTSKEDIDEIIDTHLLKGERVERLMVDAPKTAAKV
ncbi:MAG: (2Fe-2S) ferredoxin [Alphaproteobacteria bacterium]|jgi:(2Fe-2S) ferredoxin